MIKPYIYTSYDLYQISYDDVYIWTCDNGVGQVGGGWWLWSCRFGKNVDGDDHRNFLEKGTTIAYLLY